MGNARPLAEFNQFDWIQIDFAPPNQPTKGRRSTDASPKKLKTYLIKNEWIIDPKDI
jgi:hypothetical protein